MNYAIIAAGDGSRLIQEGIKTSKPFIKLNGITLIDRLINIFCKNNAASISIIVNEKMIDVYRYLYTLQLPVPINIIVKSTPSSLHSFFELGIFLKQEKFCLTTIDTIFEENDFITFIREFEKNAFFVDGMMAVTDYIDDEKPLYISINEKTFEINNFSNNPCSRYISGGIYCLTPYAIKILNNCVKIKISHMRNYQQQLITNGLKLKAYPFNKIFDIDHADDIIKAENFLKTHKNISLPKIAGIKRNNWYSPGHISNDAAIFNLTFEYLKKKNCKVVVYSEDEFQNRSINADLIFTMARNPKSVRKLQELESTGKKVINSGYGIENCFRENITRLLLANCIPHPQSIIVPTNYFSFSDIKILGSHCWIKRGDFQSIQKEDVSYVHVGKIENIIQNYALRGILTVVINEHLQGDLVKFYGVDETNFFYWFYPNISHSKFGLEKINGKQKGIPFNYVFLKKICTYIARLLNIRIYGGDCVIDKNGIIRIIDFNDWPSFAPCRNEAVPYIAECIYKQLL